ncbi:MAG TPA: hypothetical protein VG841_13220 [Caulobacterales bacterium]|nr:hypothetical protein [Caulobacterales bacterium]
MLFIARWLLVLVLLVLVAASLFPAAVTTIVQNHLPVDLTAVSSQLEQLGSAATPLELGLWYAAAFFFFVAAVRLIRRTQAFWAWLLAFACYGGRWALQEQEQPGGALSTIQSLKIDDFRPENLATIGPSTQVTLLGVILVIGVLLLIMDIADRRFWDHQTA